MAAKKASKRRPGGRPARKVPKKPSPNDRADLALSLMDERTAAFMEVLREVLEQAEPNFDSFEQVATAKIRESVTDAAALMDPWDALDLLVWLRLSVLPNALMYRESEHEGLISLVELAAVMLLQRESPEPVTSLEAAGGLASPSEVAEVCGRLLGTLERSLRLAGVRGTGGVFEHGVVSITPHEAVMRELILRNPGYPNIEREQLASLYGDPKVADCWVGPLGFSIEEALAVVDYLGERLLTALDEAIEEARAYVADDELPVPEELADLSLRFPDRTREIKVLASMALLQHGLGRRSSSTVAEIAAATGVRLAAVGSLVAIMSQPFQGRPENALAQAEGFLGGNNVVRVRPIIDVGDDSYFTIDAGSLLFALRPAIWRHLPESQQNPFKSAQADWMVEEAVRLLSALVGPAEVYKNLEYIAPDGIAYELDALLVLDRVAVPVEAKGVLLTDKARQGNAARLKRDLGRMVSEPMEQAGRVRNAILAEGRLRPRGKSAVPIDLSHVTRIFPTVVTLEDVSSIGGSAEELIQRGFLNHDDTPPWVVSLHDLRVMAEVFDRPSRFLAYLDQRMVAVGQEVMKVPEELDLMMIFLEDGLWLGDYLDDNGTPTVRLLSVSRTDPLDEYFMSQVVPGLPAAEKPRQKWSPKGFEELIERLERERPDGWTTAAIHLHKMGSDERRAFGSRLSQLARKSRLDGREHTATHLYSDPHYPRSGVTFASAPASWTRDQLEAMLKTLVTCRKHVEGADLWTGIGVLSSRAHDALVLIQLDVPWAVDEEVGAQAASLGMVPFATLPLDEARRGGPSSALDGHNLSVDS